MFEINLVIVINTFAPSLAILLKKEAPAEALITFF